MNVCVLVILNKRKLIIIIIIIIMMSYVKAGQTYVKDENEDGGLIESEVYGE